MRGMYMSEFQENLNQNTARSQDKVNEANHSIEVKA